MHATTPAIAEHDRPAARPAADGARSSPLIWILALALVAQVGLALLLTLGRPDLGAGTDSPLLALDLAKVDRLRIERPGSDPLVMERRDGRWVLPALADFPAAEGKVDELLDRLVGLRQRLPVATSQEALTRFKVAETAFEGRLTASAGDQVLATLYLGESAGFRRQYVRADGQKAVFEAQIGPADTPVAPNDWADKAWLRQAERDVRRLSLHGLTLEREKEGDGWRLVDAAAGETLDQAATKELLGQLATLTFTDVLGTEERPEYGQQEPLLEWQVGLASGELVGYRLSRPAGPKAEPAEGQTGTETSPPPAEPEWYVLKRSDRPHYLKVPAYVVQRLVGMTRADLLVEPVAPDANETPAEHQADPGTEAGTTPDADAAATAEATPVGGTAETAAPAADGSP